MQHHFTCMWQKYAHICLECFCFNKKLTVVLYMQVYSHKTVHLVYRHFDHVTNQAKTGEATKPWGYHASYRQMFYRCKFIKWCTCYVSGKNLAAIMAPTSGARTKKMQDRIFSKCVILLKHGDFQRSADGYACHPTSIDMEKIKSRDGKSQRKSVEFTSSMSPDDVKAKLEEAFPYLANKR